MVTASLAAQCPSVIAPYHADRLLVAERGAVNTWIGGPTLSAGITNRRTRKTYCARKHNDVMGMLAIYNEAVRETDIHIAEAEMRHLCELLEQQIDA